MKKSNYFLIIISLILNFMSIPISVSASEIESRQMEFVILLDVSASMGAPTEGAPGADPMQNGTRLSIEAIKNFIWKSPSYADTRISLIVYHHSAETVFKKLNIRTNGKNVSNYLDNVLKGNINIMQDIWNGSTNIEEPLKLAKDILNETTDASIKKGVILFTDGRVEIDPQHYAGPAPWRSPKAIEIENECMKIVGEFNKENIKFYSVGLNDMDRRDFPTLDPEFLEKLGEIAEQEPFIVDRLAGDDLDNLIKEFEKIFSDFWGLPIGEPRGESIFAGIPHSEPINIYGEITREVNISITTRKLLNYIKVYTPNNENAVYDSRRENNADNIIVNQSVKVSNIKIINPIDGEWIIEIEGSEDDTVKINQINLYEGSIKSSPKDGNKHDVWLFNDDTGKRIVLPRIYNPEEVDFYCVLIGKSNQLANNVEWEINDQGNGYEIDVSNLPPDEYILNAKLVSKDGYFTYPKANDSKPVDIIITIPDKILKLSTDKPIDSPISLGTDITFHVELLEESETVISPNPDWKVALYIGEEIYEMVLSGTHYEYSKKFDTVDNYTASASILMPYKITSDMATFEIVMPLLPNAENINDGINFFMHNQDEKNKITNYSVYIADNEENLKMFLNNGINYTDNIILKENVEVYENPDYAKQVMYFLSNDEITEKYNLNGSTVLYYAIKEVINQVECTVDISTVQWTPSPSFGFLIFIGIVILGLIFVLILFKKVTHIITINEVEYTVTQKNSLLITTNEDIRKNCCVVDYLNKSSFENKNLAKIQATWSGLPFPRFYNKIKVVKEHDEDIQLEQTEENPISSDTDFTLNFESDEAKLPVDIYYKIKESAKRVKDDLEDEDTLKY